MTGNGIVGKGGTNMQNQQHNNNGSVNRASGSLAYNYTASARASEHRASLLSLFVMGWMHRHQPVGESARSFG